MNLTVTSRSLEILPKIVSEYDQEIPQSQTADNPVAPRGRAFKLWADAFTHKIWNSYLKEYWRYAPDSMQFLETRSEVKFKVTETQLWYLTLCHPKMQLHTDFEILTSNNIRDMLLTRLLKKLGQKSRSPWPVNGIRHSVIPKSICTPNLEFLYQRI